MYRSLKYNKKRNVGLVHEFFARHLGQAVMDNSNTEIAKTKALLRKHFNKSTDLHKELRLFRTLLETRVSSREAALTLIAKVREAARTQSHARLELEKTGLIHEINSSLGGDRFFGHPVEDYKTYGTIQVLLDTWRNTDLCEAVSETFALEERVVDHLTRPPTPQGSGVLSMRTEDIDGLVVRILTEKVNRRFSDALTSEQRKVIQSYVFAKDNVVNAQTLTVLLEALKARALSAIDKSKSEFANDTLLLEKVGLVTSLLNGDYCNTNSPTEEMVVFYLGLPSLETELLNHA